MTLKIERYSYFKDRRGQPFKVVGGRLHGTLSLKPEDQLAIYKNDKLFGFLRVINVLYTRYTGDPTHPWSEFCVGYDGNVAELVGCELREVTGK